MYIEEYDISSEEISVLNSKNISKDEEKTKEVIREIIDKTDKETIRNIVTLGKYTDSRPLVTAADRGTISLRLVLSISLILDINPFKITGDFENFKGNEGLNHEILTSFLDQAGYSNVLKKDNLDVLKKRLMGLTSNLINEIEADDLESLKALSTDEILILLQSHMIKSKEKEDDLRTLLVKLLLFK